MCVGPAGRPAPTPPPPAASLAAPGTRTRCSRRYLLGRLFTRMAILLPPTLLLVVYWFLPSPFFGVPSRPNGVRAASGSAGVPTSASGCGFSARAQRSAAVIEPSRRKTFSNPYSNVGPIPGGGQQAGTCLAETVQHGGCWRPEKLLVNVMTTSRSTPAPP